MVIRIDALRINLIRGWFKIELNENINWLLSELTT